jgi:hypothetical protein
VGPPGGKAPGTAAKLRLNSTAGSPARPEFERAPQLFNDCAVLVELSSRVQQIKPTRVAARVPLRNARLRSWVGAPYASLIVWSEWEDVLSVLPGQAELSANRDVDDARECGPPRRLTGIIGSVTFGSD